TPLRCCFHSHSTPHTQIYTLSLHDALPISANRVQGLIQPRGVFVHVHDRQAHVETDARHECFDLSFHILADCPDCVTLRLGRCRSEEHTSELQSRENLVCRLLLEKKKTKIA